MDSGPGWKKTGDGWVLFKPTRWSETYRITEEEHRHVRSAQTAELWTATLSIIPVGAIWLLWWNGLFDLRWAVAALCVYLVANSWLSYRRSRVVKQVTLRAARSAIEIEHEPFRALANKAAADLKNNYTAGIRSKAIVLGYFSLVYGLASVVLSQLDVARVFGLPVLRAPVVYFLLALGIGILLIMRPWGNRRT